MAYIGGWDVELKMKLKEVLIQKGMSQKELIIKTGLRPNAISEMANNSRQTINRKQVAKVIKALGVNDLNELFVLVDEEQ